LSRSATKSHLDAYKDVRLLVRRKNEFLRTVLANPRAVAAEALLGD